MLKNVLEREIKFQLLILSTSACLWPSCLPKHEWSWKSNSFWRRLWQDSWAVNLRKRERWVWPWTAPFCHYWQSPNVSTGHLFASLAIWLARWRPGDLILLCWFYQVGFTGFFFSLFFFFGGGNLVIIIFSSYSEDIWITLKETSKTANYPNVPMVLQSWI